MLHTIKRLAMAGAATAGLFSGATATAPAANAAGGYNIMIDVRETFFVADYCLLSDTSGNKGAACSGNKPAFTSFREGVAYKPGDRVWIDINIVGGKDRKGIDLKGSRYIRVSGSTLAVQVCGWDSLAQYHSGMAGASLHGTAFCAPG
ncbi:hypothetical protein AB0K09_19760 [Streptomyces sp. NPDC049577]|uniref:hypothetical protein n=1 Tax=Streptomyces sp. NPDC049577 TaxID=3155153 RepID=UPI00343E109D